MQMRTKQECIAKRVVKEGLFGNRVTPGINRRRGTRHRGVFGSHQISYYTGLERFQNKTDTGCYTYSSVEVWVCTSSMVGYEGIH